MVHLTRSLPARGIPKPRPLAAAEAKTIPPHQRKAMGKVVAAQCFGMLTVQMLSGGLLLLYLNALGAPPARILALIALGPSLSALFGLPIAWLSDRTGIKVFGAWGNGLVAVGMALLASAGFFQPLGSGAVLAALVAGLGVHTLGTALFNSGWFSLLSHVVPSHFTGRFFAILRSSWQVVAITFFAVAALFFSPRTPVHVYQVLFALGAVSVGLRGLFYRDIPEAPRQPGPSRSLVATTADALRLPGLPQYLAYLIILVAVTGNAAEMLRLSAVRGSGFGDDQVLLMSVAGMIGALAGFSAAGPLADRLGADKVFLGCHFAFCSVLALFPARHILPVPAPILGIAAAALLGTCAAALGIAIITRSFATCTGPSRTMALALVQAAQTLGAGLGGFLLAACIARLRAPGSLAAPGPSGAGWNPFDTVLMGLSAFILCQIAWHQWTSRRTATHFQGSPA